ncbi:MAG: DUF1330 domain-containing protein [Chitinophagaceae bacterium]|nr:DUF1330 domain-containing protein [Chitinophagaceae bacterium]
MIYVTQLIYVVPGQERVFDEFESIALPAIPRYKGRLLFRMRPGSGAYIESSIEAPYEVHLVEFESEADLLHYMNDENRKKFLHLKERSVRSALVIKGQKIG